MAENRLQVTIDVEEMLLEDYLDLVEPESQRAQFQALDKFVTVDGYFSVLSLPLTALSDLVDEVSLSLKKVANPEGNSDGGS